MDLFQKTDFIALCFYTHKSILAPYHFTLSRINEKDKTAKKCQIIVAVMQKDRRKNGHKYQLPIGFSIHKVEKIE